MFSPKMITRCLMGVAVSPWLLFLSLSARGDGGMGPAIMAGLSIIATRPRARNFRIIFFLPPKRVGCRSVNRTASVRRLCREHYECINAAQILNDAHQKNSHKNNLQSDTAGFNLGDGINHAPRNALLL